MDIRIENLTKTIKDVTVLSNINLKLSSGKIVGLRGKNGSGKTMLMRALCGLILPTSGRIVINDETLGKEISFPRSVGVLIENPSFLPAYTGFQNLKMLASIKGEISDEQIKATLASVGLVPDDKRKYRKYSLGMKQRLGIACAVMESPELLILDEPINALDDKGVDLVKELILKLRDNGALIIVACHDASELEYLSDEIYSIAEGHLCKEEREEPTL
jgi:ABC-2 type transport system ATP-binding protein